MHRQGWFYFKIKIASKIENLLLNRNEDNAVKYILLPNCTSSNELYYIAIINTWIILNKIRIFYMHDNLGINIK